MKRLLALFTVFFLLTLPTIVMAQPELFDGPEQTPIDGGIGILAAAGGAYALKKLREKSDTC